MRVYHGWAEIMVYWAFAGVLYLVWMTWQDLFNNLKVDDRKNWFMYGFTFGLVYLYPYKLWYLLLLFGIMMFFRFGVLNWFKEQGRVGEADINTLVWVVTGFTLLNPLSLIVFFSAFLVITILYMFLKETVFKISGKTAFYPVLLCSFVFVCLVYRFFY